MPGGEKIYELAKRQNRETEDQKDIGDILKCFGQNDRKKQLKSETAAKEYYYYYDYYFHHYRFPIVPFFVIIIDIIFFSITA